MRLKQGIRPERLAHRFSSRDCNGARTLLSDLRIRDELCDVGALAGAIENLRKH
jgi:hypothetical protein